MYGKQLLVTGMATAVVFVGFALAPANADFKAPIVTVSAVKQVGTIAVAPLNAAETPQDQVSDMSYGK